MNYLHNTLSGLRRHLLPGLMLLTVYCSFSAFAQTPAISLPTGTIGNIAEGFGGANTYLTVIMPSTFPTGSSILPNGTYGAWCVDYGSAMPNGYYAFNIYSSYDPNISSEVPVNMQAAKWNQINWLLNNQNGYNNDAAGATITEIQDAIWTLADESFNSGVPTPASVDNDAVTIQLLNDAALYGASFVPQGGQYIAVVFVPNPVNSGAQTFILALQLPSNLTPNVSITKTASATSPINPFQPVTYTYTVKNGGNVDLSNVTVIDDNGTPDYPIDDVTVVSNASIAAGVTKTYQLTLIPKVNVSATNSNGTSIDDNILLVSKPTSGPWAGDLVVSYIQSLQMNDNSYGTNSSAAWKNAGRTHQFSDLLGTDQAEFQFTNNSGAVVLDFRCDYLSKTASAKFASGTIAYSSGYGTLGPNGGDGKMITGSAANVLFATTTLTQDLNQSKEFGQYTTNSPAPSSADFAMWNQYNGYTVVISPAAFGGSLANFGGVKIAGIQNSPAINGTDTPSLHIICNSSVTNTATVTAAATINGVQQTLKDSAQATVTIQSNNSSSACNSGCSTAASNSSNFLSTCINSNQALWLTSVITLTEPVPAGGLTINITGGTIKLPDGSSILAPNGTIIFSPNARTTSTTYSNGAWETIVPVNTQGAVFATAVAYTPTSQLCPKGSELITWNATFTSSVPGVDVDWRWSASAYNTWGTNPAQHYDWICPKSVDGYGDCRYRNNDCAGTPESFKSDLCPGGTGLGGAQYCGLRGGSVDVTICPPVNQSPKPPSHCHVPSPGPHCPPPTPVCHR